MINNIYNKIKKYITVKELSWIIIDSFTHKELASLMERLGIIYRGIRTIKIPHLRLAEDLADDILKYREIAHICIKKLIDVNAETIKKVNSLSFKNLNIWLNDNLEFFYREGILGRVIWALIVDNREQVNNVIKPYIKKIETFLEEQDKEFLVGETIREIIEEEAPRVFKKRLTLLSKENAKLKQHLKKILNEYNKLIKKSNELKDRLKHQEKEVAGLRYEKGQLLRNLRKKEEEVNSLKRKLADEKINLKSTSLRALKHTINTLQRENKKISYELDKYEKIYPYRLEELEKQTLQLRRNLEIAQQKEEQLKKELEQLKEKPSGEGEKNKGYYRGETNVFPHKGKRVALFVDTQNIYYTARSQFDGKLDYAKLLTYLVGNRHLVKAICYIVQHPLLNKDNFINMLRRIGYTIKTRGLIMRADGSAKGNWDIGMAMDVINMVEDKQLDTVILVTCDGDFVDLVKILKKKGIRVEVAGFLKTTAIDLKRISDEFIVIDEDLILKDERNNHSPYS